MEVPAIPPSDSFRFRTRRATRWGDEDSQGVVNNAVYMSLLEEARYDYFGALGLIEDNRFSFVLMQTNIRFLSPSRGGSAVEIELMTVDLGTSSVRQWARIREPESDRVLVEAEVLLVCWSNEERRKVPMSPEFRSRVAAFEGLAGDGSRTSSGPK